MMWSQWRWDMKTWNSPGLPFNSRSASPAAGRAPDPMSKRSRPAPSERTSTQEELPPNVCATAKGSVSTKAAALSAVSSSLPVAATSAATIFSRTERAVIAAGMDPRVPQKRTCISARGERRDRLVHAGVAREDLVEAADLENLVHERLQRRHRDLAARALGFLRGEHEHAQSRARDVIDSGEVEDDDLAFLRGVGYERDQASFQLLGRPHVDAPDGHNDHRLAGASLGKLHWMSPSGIGCRILCQT